LPYGEYTFQVLVCNEDEVWNEVGDSLTFSIQPYFYETWSFYILCGFFTIAIVIGVIRWRTYQVQHQNEKLENLVRERTSEIEQQKTEIQQKNEILNEFNEKITATLQTVELQNFEIQDKNKNITDSINYAKRIQTAMLSITSFEYILGAKNFFILFKPRDIVSGDFYWIAQLKEKIIITVADCTGHGVPGAFVSMVGNSFLNEIVLGEGFSAPQVILKRLHKKIVDFFHQQENLNELVIDDGMDIVILTLQKDTQTQKIVKASYSGAMNPLYYVQNQQLFEIKASKKSIGGWRMTESRAFEMHEIDLDSPTIFYLCTDGYQDQFGGEKGKKFMVKNLKEKLLSLHSKELLEQKNDLDLTINNWISSAKEAQTDDITIVGVKVGE
jgi:serine phosphatase RsbU (regulator of sigma subunit)